jgi:hypothetical protein
MKNETVWKTLSSIDVNNKTEKKGNLTYLSWAWAWGELMNHFPEATYTFTEWEYPNGQSYVTKDVLIYDDGTCSVECELRIEDLVRKMWLPVMDYRNNAIENPTARQISDTKMRCLVKCISMFGLGHYIYAGEDLPQESASPPASKDKAPVKKKSKLTKAQQADVEKIRELVTTHTVFTNNNGGTEMQKQVLQVIDGDPTVSQVNEWMAYVVGEASLYDNEQKDKEYHGRQNTDKVQ